MDSVHAGGLGGTYGGNPVACAAALGAIETMQARTCRARAREIEATFLAAARTRSRERHPDRVGDVRGRGAMLAIELVSRRPGTYAGRRPRRQRSTGPATRRVW